ncbi:MAG TPA: glycoside hydrolase family 9 protein [Puia sp.]|nr:glycoside hydrolase family 9 protein [Puia sp.]
MRTLPFLFLLLASAPFQSPVPPPAIAVNQLGFYVHGPKFAVATGAATRDLFYIVSVYPSASRTLRADTVFTGRLGPVTASPNSSLSTRLADFSGFYGSGTFLVAVPGLPDSYPFTVGDRVFSRLTEAALKGYYYQRSAMELTRAYAGAWARPTGHPDTAVLVHASAAGPARPAGSIVSVTGGWYDAGDYNKYVVNSGITMGTLLDAYEDFPGYFDSLKTNIPPVGRGGAAVGRAAPVKGAGAAAARRVPDILNEALYNLRWMLRMQDPADGGVYNKCTNAAFDGMVMPGVTKAPRYVVQKGTAAALDFAATTAQAARLFARFPDQLPGLADSCRQASVRAWHWASQYPDSVYDQNALNRKFSPAISTGAYGDRFFGDERFWAASELLITTGDTTYLPAVLAGIGTAPRLPSWSNVGTMGDYSLLRHRLQLPGSLSEAVDSMRHRLLALADGYIEGEGRTGFHTVMGEKRSDFIWGSNSVCANQGMLLINAWLQQQKKAYLDGAVSNLDYLLGRNATGYCFVTGMGSHPPMHPHHRPSIADGVVAPVPGLLAGGANPGRQDHQVYMYLEPETSYLDNDQGYASNEIAINWNAPLVYLSGGLEALQYAAGYSTDGPGPRRKGTLLSKPGKRLRGK